MTIGATMLALGESFRDMSNGELVFNALEEQFREFGATHFLATGLPLPGRPIDPLILRLRWGDVRVDRNGHGVRPDDALLQFAHNARRPFTLLDSPEQHVSGESALLNDLGPGASVVGVPICAFLPYQGVVVAGGTTLNLDARASLTIDHVCTEAFRRLFALGFMKPERPGDLSARERRVLELSALGKTANQIASILEISQRTVHAHLQNASEKLRAHNKTHTVVEALRYGQITV
jgi:LuxR family transcriptional regulator, quorum-sensing system regulator BjaR1